ncbi:MULTISPECIES: MalY/PatB family protein [Mesorhizobium]|uniref:MalY/PatB family protein n=1 Tax=Mesorhizobium TaxID=68287 RepID=UPI0010A96DFF|nr:MULTISPECIES: PatB family C-S lyase [Mesorhizobium]
MINDFDRLIDRRHTNSVAESGYEDYLFGGSELPRLDMPRSDIISMWVADMQFAAPQAALNAITERMQRPIFGYTMNLDDELYEAFHDWSRDRYGWSFRRDEMQTSQGVVPALYALVEYVCKPGEKVLSLSPAYGYFKRSADYSAREFVTSPLRKHDGSYTVDFADFETKARDPAVKLFFLCHPHNPTGRAWSEGELRRMADICFDNGVMIVSDEVHCDLLRHGKRHVPLARLFPDRKDIVTCMAVSKTFNMAGMMIATIIIPDPDLRAIWKQRHSPFLNPLSLAAATGAYRNGAPWLDELRTYLDDNFAWVEAFLRAELPEARFRIPDATYLAWIDLGAYFPDSINLTKFFLEKAGVVLEGGEMFVNNGENMVRLSLACPQSQVRAAMERIRDSVKAKVLETAS